MRFTSHNTVDVPRPGNIDPGSKSKSYPARANNSDRGTITTNLAILRCYCAICHIRRYAFLGLTRALSFGSWKSESLALLVVIVRATTPFRPPPYAPQTDLRDRKSRHVVAVVVIAASLASEMRGRGHRPAVIDQRCSFKGHHDSSFVCLRPPFLNGATALASLTSFIAP